MSPDLLFAICNTVVLPGWLLLVVAPRWKWGSQFICPMVLPGLLSLSYALLVISQWQYVEGGFGTLIQVEQVFKNRFALVGGWIHYLAFDLFIGSWEVRDAQRLGISHWFVVPCLAFTALFGPAGLLLYFAVRLSLRRELFVSST